MARLEQGLICWLESPDVKRRPCLVLTRNRSIDVLHDVIVVPLSTRVRGLATEVELLPGDGVPQPCVANLQHVTSVPKSLLTRPIGRIRPDRWHEVCEALRVAIGC
jgi:mRNA interferase MazF